MKPLFILALGLTMLTLGVNAQSNMDAKVGVKAGGNMMMMGKIDFLGTEYTSKYVPGWQAGFFLDLPLSEKLSFMPEVLYSQKGGKVKETVAGGTGEIRSRVGYIDVPVLLSFNASPELSFVLGPQASFLIDHNTKTYINDQLFSTETGKDNLRSSVAGGVVGIGYKFSPKLNLNARYNMDFQSAAKEDINQDKTRFSGFALSVGFGF
ncbi:MAG: PorT family protein [Pedobacter sp.]|nr:MAG: PorT family protein [Pedobacter sp.]